MPSNPTHIDWRASLGRQFTEIPVLVTGGAGFIGSHLVDALAALGARITIIDDLTGGLRENIAHHGHVEFVQASILDRAALDQASAGQQVIFHLAALGSVPASVERPEQYHAVNALGALNVLEAARRAGVRRVVFSASSSAYGDNPVPWSEGMPTLPKSPYAASKAYGEALMRAYSASYALDTVSLRYFNIFGPRQNANSAYAAVIAAFASAYLRGVAPTIYGDGSQTRDFTFVANPVYANLLAAAHNTPLQGEVINVGCGRQISVLQLASQMAKALGREDLAPVHVARRAGDLEHSFAAMTRARTQLGYQPLIDFEAGLPLTLEWCRMHMKV